MRGAAILGVSVVLHAALLLVLPGSETRLVQRAPDASANDDEVEVEPAPAPAPPPDDTMAIQLVTLPATAPATAAPATAPAPAAAPATTHGPAHAAVSIRATDVTTSGIATAVEPGAPDDTGELAMREAHKQGTGASLGLTDSPVLEAILSRPPREEPEPSGELEANRDGTYTNHDLTFTAQFDEDGNITSIEDKPNFHFKVHIPHPKKIIRAIGKHLYDWAQDPEGVGDNTGHAATQLPNSDDHTDGQIYTIIDGGFDLTDAVMRAVGMDPYSARKRKMLEDTFDERAQIHANHKAKQYAESDQLMLRNLSTLWLRADLDAAAKRELTFELWDECAESGGKDVVAAGALARDALLRYVAIHIPAGSADAYTADELAQLNAKKKSTATFAPYQDK